MSKVFSSQLVPFSGRCTRATLIGDLLHSGEKLWFYDKLFGRKGRIYRANLFEHGAAAHGGGDWALMDAFIQLLRKSIAKPLTSTQTSLESHIMAFAAEKSRLEEKVINVAEYRREVMKSD